MAVKNRSIEPDREARTLVSPRHLIFTVVLLVALVGVYIFLDARRIQGDLEREVRERSTALLGILETSARNAIAENALVEELIGQRLLDNAHLIDDLLATRKFDASRVDQVVARNHLRKIEFLDRAAGGPAGTPTGDGSAPPRRVVRPGIGQVYEVARPFPLGKDRTGLLHLGLSVGPIQTVWAQDQRNMFITLVREEAAAKGIAIEAELALNGAAARLDCRQVHQALLNIVLNAFQAMPRGGTLRLSAGRKDGQLELAIADTGSGIPPEHLDRIFEPYFTTKEGGTGLALAQRIVEAHGGRITVDSRLGMGSTFRIRLPLEGPQEVPHA